jgi:hypothetical protein
MKSDLIVTEVLKMVTMKESIPQLQIPKDLPNNCVFQHTWEGYMESLTTV